MKELLAHDPPLQSWSAWTSLWLVVRDLQNEVAALRAENVALRQELQALRAVPPQPPNRKGLTGGKS